MPKRKSLPEYLCTCGHALAVHAHDGIVAKECCGRNCLRGKLAMTMTKVVVHLSGGAASWMAGKRAAAKYGTEGMVCLFADTMSEDEDTYRFLPEAAANIGAPLVRLADGRTIWEVFRDERFLGNSRIDPCSRILKREIMDDWIKTNAPDSIQVFGFDWHEAHRLERMRQIRPDLRIEAPLLDKPLLMKSQILAMLRGEGITPPRLYAMGFDHNNCGGGKEPLTLRQLRERIEMQGTFDREDWGTCGCFQTEGMPREAP